VHEAVREVLEVNLAHNPLFSRFRCIVELPDASSRGVPVLDAGVVDSHHAERAAA
jgi:hypothetical protein